jgi:hypothetical protein
LLVSLCVLFSLSEDDPGMRVLDPLSRRSPLVVADVKIDTGSVFGDMVEQLDEMGVPIARQLRKGFHVLLRDYQIAALQWQSSTIEGCDQISELCLGQNGHFPVVRTKRTVTHQLFPPSLDIIDIDIYVCQVLSNSSDFASLLTYEKINCQMS